MAPNSKAFVEAVWEELGATGKTDFARKLGLGPDGLQKVRRWLRGGRLDYADTMSMLEKTGWFSMNEGRPRVATDPGDPLEEHGMWNADLLENQKTALSLLGEIRGELRTLQRALHTAPTQTPKKTR